MGASSLLAACGGDSERGRRGGRPRVVFEDDFQRADGVLGTAPTGEVWTVDGTAPPTIVDRQLTVAMPTTPSNAGYAYVDLEKVSPTIRTRFTIRSGGISPSSTVALLVSRSDSELLTNTVHLICTSRLWSIQIIAGKLGFGGVTVVTLASGSYPDLPPGEYEMSARISGNTVTLTDPNGNQHPHTDARFSTFWGTRQCYELQNRPNCREIRLSLASARPSSPPKTSASA